MANITTEVPLRPAGSFKHGVSNDNREKIVPPATGPEVKGFGYSISKGLDVTGNRYLDFAVGECPWKLTLTDSELSEKITSDCIMFTQIKKKNRRLSGAVLSGHGFVYRSRPVVIVRASISLNEKQIPKEGGKCAVNGR